MFRPSLLPGFMLMSLLAATPCARAAVTWGGSVSLTTDYLVRGISRSDHDPSLQAEVHASGKSGWFAGLFVATTRIAPGARRDAEVGALLGYSRDWNEDWASRVIVSHYSYPWNEAGSAYDYNEIACDLAFRGWLSFSAIYSPDAPRYNPYYGLIAANAGSAEVNLQSPAWHRLMFNAGVGYSHYAGADGGGFTYWSAGGTLDLAPLSLTVGFVDSSAGSIALFDETATQHRWVATLMWRF